MLCVALCLSGCGGFESQEDGWYRRILSGQLQPMPFSHDLQLLGYQGWHFIGKLPRRGARATAVRVSLWHDVYDGIVEPVLLVSHRPPPDEGSGFYTVPEGGDLRRVQADLLLRRTLEDGYPVFTSRMLVNGVEVTRRLEVPEGSRFDLTLLPATRSTLRLGEEIAVAEATIEGWTQRVAGETSYTTQRRTFRWFLRLDPITGE